MSIQVQSNNPEADKAAMALDAKVDAPADGAVTTAPADQTAAAEQVADSVTAKTEEVETEGNTDTDKGPENDAGGDAVGKKKGGFQRKIDRAIREKSAAEQERDYWKSEALKAASSKPEPKVEIPAANAAGEPDPEKFGSHSEYVKALAKWEYKQARAEEKAQEDRSRIETQSQKLVREYNQRERTFVEKTDNFQDVIDEAMTTGVRLSPSVHDIFLNSENGPELLYELAKNKEEFARVNNLSPLAAAREIGKLEARLQKPASETKEQKTTQAPKPINPVRASGKGQVTKSIDDPTLSQAEFDAIRNEQIKKRRQA